MIITNVTNGLPLADAGKDGRPIQQKHAVQYSDYKSVSNMMTPSFIHSPSYLYHVMDWKQVEMKWMEQWRMMMEVMMMKR